MKNYWAQTPQNLALTKILHKISKTSTPQSDVQHSFVWWYLASLVFGKNCRKIGINTSGPESIKWWHHQCVSHKVMTSPMSVQSESSICRGAFPTVWIFIKNPLVTSSLFAFQIKYFHSPRLFHTAPSNSKVCQVPSLTRRVSSLVGSARNEKGTSSRKYSFAAVS